MEIRRRQTSAQSASESAALGKAGHGSAETGRAVPSAQSKKEPLAALFLCAAARRIRGGTPHPPRQARHLPPLGKAKDHFCFHAVCKVLTASVALWELYFRNQTKPSPVGEGGPLAVDEVFNRKVKRIVEGADPYRVCAVFLPHTAHSQRKKNHPSGWLFSYIYNIYISLISRSRSRGRTSA